MPEYLAEIKFHIFPYRKLKISAKNEVEAKKIAITHAEDIVKNLKFTIKKLKQRQVLIEDFL
ncbi:MAG: hypothetical protein ACFFBH_05365 [Promethearchaeota archaeon]